jgi:site-specific recombinase XerC
VTVGVVRSLGTARRLRSAQELEDFEQELIDQFALAAVGAETDQHMANERSVVFQFVRFLGRPVWTATATDADRFLVAERKDRGLAKHTVQRKAWTIERFFDFLIGPIRATSTR